MCSECSREDDNEDAAFEADDVDDVGADDDDVVSYRIVAHTSVPKSVWTRLQALLRSLGPALKVPGAAAGEWVELPLALDQNLHLRCHRGECSDSEHTEEGRGIRTRWGLLCRLDLGDGLVLTHEYAVGS